ncbi:MAG: cytochrome c biogenesis protein ResB [Candidatus Aminicenantales bacterium]
MSSLIRFFTSVKVAITLIIILTLASLLGTLIPQGRSHAEYLLHYGQLANLFEGLQLTRLYHSFWYLTLLFLFGLNLTICTLLRLPPKIKRYFRPRVDFQRGDLEALRVHRSLNLNADLNSIQLALRAILKSHHYRWKEKRSDAELTINGRKRMAGIFGSDVVHLAILLILIGGIISGLLSFRTDLALHEGEVAAVPPGGFSVRLDSFRTEYYPGGQVKDWKSKLTVVKDGREIVSKTVEVNHPLSYKNFMFYQSAYGWNWDKGEVELILRPVADGAGEKRVRARIGEKTSIDEATELLVRHFLPDFVLDENRQPFSRSNEPNNPAALVEIIRNGEKVYSGWLFARFPDFSQLHPGKSSPFSVELRNYSASQYSVIHVSRDPGTGFIWAGCILIMLGLALAFYWPPREIRLHLRSEAGRVVLVAGGIASKNRESFEKEMETIITSIRKKK